MYKMTFAIERKEVNPHQSKQPLLKNRTYIAERWKAIMFIENSTEEQAIARFIKKRGYRLVNWDNLEIIIDEPFN